VQINPKASFVQCQKRQPCIKKVAKLSATGSRRSFLQSSTDIIGMPIYSILADIAMLPMYQIGKIPPVHIGSICS